MTMADDNPPFLKGTLAVLILKALSWAPMHGFELSAWIEEHSGAAFRRATKVPVDHRPGDRVGGWARARFARAGRS